MVKLEVDGAYKSRGGLRADVISHELDGHSDHIPYFVKYSDGAEYYLSEDGRVWQTSESPRDLMAEWTDLPAEVIGADAQSFNAETMPESLLDDLQAAYPADPVSQPPHYRQHPSGIECIQITEHMGFNLGNAIKYIWRCDLKQDAIEDLKKAAWYIQREIEKREKQ